MTKPAIAPTRSPRLDELTSLRFFLALLVVCYHGSLTPWLVTAMASAPWWLANVAATGYVAVSFFFVLSGFVLTYSYGDRGVPFDRKQFAWARFARLYPLHVFALLIDALPAFLAIRRQSSSLPGAAWSFAWTGAVNLSLFNSFFKTAGIVWNGPAWSLSAEAFFYLVFPWCLGWASRFSRGRLVAACFATVVLSVLGPALWVAFDPGIADWMGNADEPPLGSARFEPWMTLVAYSPVGRVFEFGLGVALGRLFLTRSTRRSDTVGSLAVLGAVALSVGVMTLSSRIPRILINNGCMDLGFAVIIYQVARGPTWLSPVLRLPIFVLLGEASYALYILHMPIYHWVSHAGRLWAGPGSLLFSLYLAFSVIASTIAYLHVEKPIRAWILHRHGALLRSSGRS